MEWILRGRFAKSQNNVETRSGCCLETVLQESLPFLYVFRKETLSAFFLDYLSIVFM